MRPSALMLGILISRGIAGLAVATVALPTAPMTTDGTRPDPIVVRVYDASGVAPADRTAASTVAREILRTAGIGTSWLECTRSNRSEPTACDQPPRERDLLVRLVPTPPGTQPGVLGFSYIDVERQWGQLATVYGDRVRGLADTTRVAEALVLGRAMAHELVHLLLGTTTHAAAGLMRERWKRSELETERPEDWQIAPANAKRLRSLVSARLASTSGPAAAE